MTILPSVNMFSAMTRGILLDPAFVDATNLSLYSRLHPLGSELLGLVPLSLQGLLKSPADISCAFATVGQGGSLTYLWMNAPYTYHQALGDLADSVNLQRILSSGFQELGTFEISTVARTERISSFWPFLRVGTCRQSQWKGLTGVSQVEGAFDLP